MRRDGSTKDVRHEPLTPTPDDALAEIKRLYFETTRQTIQNDVERAVRLLKSMASDDDRQRATVYMDGLAQMRSDWARAGRRKTQGSSRP